MKIGQFGDMDVDIHSQAAGETLVEWLRLGCPDDCPADCDTCGHLRKAADRIEALEAETSRQKAYIATLHEDINDDEARIEALEKQDAFHRAHIEQQAGIIARLQAALREIAGLYEGLDILHATTIARAALEGKK